MIAIDLSKRQALDADPRAIQQNKRQRGKYNNVFITEEAKETIFEFSQGTLRVL